MDKLSDIKKDFSQWYQDVIFQAEIVDSSPTKGCFVIRPYGYSIWEQIQKIVDKKIKETGTENASFPLLIPESFLKKEAKHVEGFAPELAVVTHAGGKKLEEPYVVRPTSETIIYHMFARWIKSWRNLPLKVNQWANVVRWEKRTRAFIRTTEFLWQEGHTAHTTKEEAEEFTLQILKMYKDFVQDYLAIPVITGEKSESERFAGADKTFTIEGLMPDGKALQMGTSHLLAHSFPKAFGVAYQNKDGEMESPFCTSWGVSTRLMGALLMVHGDQNGLILPPKIAPIQAVIIPIYRKDEEKAIVLEKAKQLRELLNTDNCNVVIDDDENLTPGSKFYHWELRGVPVRIEIGPKDIEKNQVVLVNRAEPERSLKKSFVSIDNVGVELEVLLDKIQKQLFAKAEENLKNNWHQSEKLSDFASTLEKNGGLYQTGWCGLEDCELKLKDFKGTIRCLLPDDKFSTCCVCGKKATSDVLIAKSY